ncbi:MAG: ABC transporter ATP-binding protein [Gammaproteobacteria bacterium]|nr:ABC transporter ATP-binding protein [Gammaproteobacteria bacterium]
MKNNDVLISVEQLSRHYGPINAIEDVSFEVRRGEVLGFLGPNGAGKSTTMQILTGNLAPSLGRVRINGFDILDQPKQAKSELGYLPETPPIYRELTVFEYLHYCARLNKIQRNQVSKAIDNAMQRCGLTDVRKRLIGNLSKGYQQRVGIAQAIIHSPSVVILDEPTVGLDPIQIREIRSLIRELGGEHSVILSTHILPEVQSTCDRVQIINQGKLVLTESIGDLNEQLQSEYLLLSFKQAPGIRALESIGGVLQVEQKNKEQFRLHINPENDPTDKIVNMSVGQNWGLYELTPERRSLEEIFMEITCSEQKIIDSSGLNSETQPQLDVGSQSQDSPPQEHKGNEQ